MHVVDVPEHSLQLPSQAEHKKFPASASFSKYSVGQESTHVFGAVFMSKYLPNRHSVHFVAVSSHSPQGEVHAAQTGLLLSA